MMKKSGFGIGLSFSTVAAILLLNFASPLSDRPEGVFLFSVLLLALSVLFFNLLGRHEVKTNRPWALSAGSYAVIIFLLLSFVWRIKHISINLPFSLDRFYHLERIAVLMMLSIPILLISLHLCVHRLMLFIENSKLKKVGNWSAAAVGILVFLPFVLFFNFDLPGYYLIFISTIYIILLNTFIRDQIPGLTWPLIWIIFYSIFAAALMHYYTKGYFFYKAFSIYSCFFILHLFIALMLYFFNKNIQIVSAEGALTIVGKASLRNKIQLIAILFTLISFASVGFTSIWFIQRLSFHNNNEAIWWQNSTEFVEMLVNIYAFLLLMTGVAGIAIANSFTQPIVNLGIKLRNLQLGHNEPIEWQSQDEIGELIVEYNRMITKLENSTEKLKISERESAWREMAKQIAHEIKNPLTPMKLSIQYLLHTAKANPQEVQPMLQRVSQTIIEQIDGLTRIATEFSNFAQMPKPENTTFVLNDAVQSVFNLFAENPDTNIALHLQLPDTPIFILADRDQIIRVLNNLLKNAIQAIPADAPGQVDMILHEINGKAHIEIRDNGCGIPAAMRDKVFQPNFTTKSSGTGLGLAMCKNMVLAAGGRIWFESDVAVGTRFFVELPIVKN